MILKGMTFFWYKGYSVKEEKRRRQRMGAFSEGGHGPEGVVAPHMQWIAYSVNFVGDI
jgi:hypothetical protein